MVERNPIATLELAGFIGGLNRDADPFLLEPNESPDALNVDFGLGGEVSKREGFSRFDSPTTAENFVRFVVWDNLGGSVHKIVVTDDNLEIFSSTGANFTSSGRSFSAPSNMREYWVSVASLNNKLYVTSLAGTAAPKGFDGTTWANVTETVFDGTSARFPKAAHIVTMHDRMFAANVMDGATNHRSRLYWSDPSDAETWEATEFTDFDPDDGEEITALSAFGEDLVVFKNSSVQVLAGRSPVSFTRYVLESGVGTVSPRSVVPHGGSLYFFDRDNGIYAFDGSGFVEIDAKIKNYVLGGINYANAYKAASFVRRGRLYVSVPWGSDTYNSRTFVYDIRTKSWSEYDFGVADADHDGATWYGVHNRNLEGVYKLFDGADDATSPVVAYFRTPWLTPGGLQTKARIRRLDTAWSALGNYDVTVDMHRNFGESTPYITQLVNTAPGGAVYGTAVYGVDKYGSGSAQVYSRTTGWGQRFNAVQFKVGTSGVGDQFQLNKLSMHVSTLSRVRGEA